MTTAEFETLDTPVAEAVLRWRFETLVEAGYDAGNALILASHVEVDLHLVTDLLARGCPPDTAMRICL